MNDAAATAPAHVDGTGGFGEREGGFAQRALAYDDAPEDYDVETQTFEVKGLLTGAGIRFMFTSFVPNFLGFTAVGLILVAMIGGGVAEDFGLVGGPVR